MHANDGLFRADDRGGVPATPGPLRFFYAFAADNLDKVHYTFRDEE